MSFRSHPTGPSPLRLRQALSVAALLTATSGATVHAQKGGVDAKGTARVGLERRASIASDASIRIAGAISSLRIVGWDRDSLVITGTMPQGWRFDGGVAGVGGHGRGA